MRPPASRAHPHQRRGRRGNELFVTEVAMADEIAAAGDLVKGTSATPC